MGGPLGSRAEPVFTVNCTCDCMLDVYVGLDGPHGSHQAWVLPGVLWLGAAVLESDCVLMTQRGGVH